MVRVHKVTHPRLGVVTWEEIQAARKAVSSSRGFKVCSWCWEPAIRTRCGKPLCNEMIWRAQCWSRCRAACLRRDKICKLCGRARSAEADHVVPVSLGGTGDLENLRGLCRACHKLETSRLRREKSLFKAA